MIIEFFQCENNIKTLLDFIVKYYFISYLYYLYISEEYQILG